MASGKRPALQADRTTQRGTLPAAQPVGDRDEEIGRHQGVSGCRMSFPAQPYSEARQKIDEIQTIDR